MRIFLYLAELRDAPPFENRTGGSKCNGLIQGKRKNTSTIAPISLNPNTRRPHLVGVLSSPSPAYLQYLRDRAAGKFKLHTRDGHPLGYRPESLDRLTLARRARVKSLPPHIYRHNLLYFLTSWLPGSTGFNINAWRKNYVLKKPHKYDLRDQGRVTPVKMQGGADCWAYAVYGSLESSLLPGETWDLSEPHMANLSGYIYSEANIWSALAYLGRWSGPIKESDYPGNSPVFWFVRKHVQESFAMPPRESNGINDPLANDWVKWALMTNGALAVDLDWEDQCFDPVNNSYYLDQVWSINHGMSVVGWDDDFDRNRFMPTSSGLPPGNGAFIVKNSWGEDWGDQGYCYISYYDAGIGNFTAFMAEPVTNYQSIYLYDPLGATDSWVFERNDEDIITIGANVFTAKAAEDLAAVSYYTMWENVQGAVAIYLDPIDGPTSPSRPATVASFLHKLAGYHTLKLPRKVPLQAGQKFSVLLASWTPSPEGCYSHPLVIERTLANQNIPPTAHPGESYVTCDGIWHDLTTQYTEDHTTHEPVSLADANLCIKAFTQPHESQSGLIPPMANISNLLQDNLNNPPHTNNIHIISTIPPAEYRAYPDTEIAAVFDAPLMAGPNVSDIRLTSGALTVPVQSSVQGTILHLVPNSTLGDTPATIGHNPWIVFIPAKAVTDIYNRGMPSDFTWSFKSTVQPILIIHTIPCDDDLVHPETEILASFNMPLQEGPSISSVQLTSGSLNMPVSCSIQGTNDLRIVPQSKLGNTSETLGHDTWTVLVPQFAVTDVYGNGMSQDYRWTFKTIVVN